MSPKTAENKSFYWLKWIAPALLLLFISVLKLFPAVIENQYSNLWYGKISSILRSITGWTSISIGDIFYTIAGIYLVVYVFKTLAILGKGQATWKGFGYGILELLRKMAWIYIWFNLVWGLNYFRLGIEYQLQITPAKYTKDEVEALTCDLIEKVNTLRRKISSDTTLPQPPIDSIFNTCQQGYTAIAERYPFLQYKHSSVKRSLYSKAGSYFGFTGYYNPFSGEAQLRDDIPRILLPYTTCHEMAHQLGYAGESEANFVGYLACASINNDYYQYSVYMDLYKYAATELFLKDLKTTHGWELDSLVKKDIRKINRFFADRRNRVSPIMNSVYDSYLKANQQDNGIESYNDVIGWLIAYKKKYGKI